MENPSPYTLLLNFEMMYESLRGLMWASLKTNSFRALEFRVYFHSLIHYEGKQTKSIFQTRPLPN